LVQSLLAWLFTYLTPSAREGRVPVTDPPTLPNTSWRKSLQKLSQPTCGWTRRVLCVLGHLYQVYAVLVKGKLPVVPSQLQNTFTSYCDFPNTSSFRGPHVVLWACHSCTKKFKRE
jgi:hypothetical protein